MGRTSETCPDPSLLLGAGVGDAAIIPKPGGTHCLMLSWMQSCLVPLPAEEAWASPGAGMLSGAGEGAREWRPHPKWSSPPAGACGPPPPMTYSRPSSDKHTISFPIGSSVTYTCIEGTIKIPGRSDMVKCLPGARWSTLPEPCGRKYLLSLRPSSKEPLAWLHASAPYSGCSAKASPPLARYRPTSHGCCLLMGAGSMLVGDGVSWMVAGAQDAPAPPKPWVSEAAKAVTPYFLLTALPVPLSHLHPCFARGAFSRIAAW